eukprot:297792-Pyramimonas_sp.AAC.1
MRINAKCASIGPECAEVPESRCPGQSVWSVREARLLWMLEQMRPMQPRLPLRVSRGPRVAIAPDC